MLSKIVTGGLVGLLCTGLIIGATPAVAHGRGADEPVELGVDQCAVDIDDKGTVLLETALLRRGRVVPLPSGLEYATALNEQGHILGMTADGAAAVWDGRRTTVLAGPDGTHTAVSLSALNERGVVVGTATSGDGTSVAFTWHRSRGYVVLPTDAPNAGANGVNNRGQVVGSMTVDGRQQAVRWEPDGTVVALPGLGDGTGHSLAAAVGPDGAAVGYSYLDGAMRPVRWTASGVVVDLGLPGATSGMATDVNRRGVVVGSQLVRGTNQQGFRAAPHGTTRLVPPLHDPGSSTVIVAVNARGAAVGCDFSGEFPRAILLGRR